MYNKDVLIQIWSNRYHPKIFTKQQEVTDIFMIDLNRVLVLDKVLSQNRKDWWYVIGYQVDEEMVIPLFLKTRKNVFSYGACR